MARTGAEPILLGGGELALDTDAEVNSKSEPTSPGVSGRSAEETLGRLERILAWTTEDSDGTADGGGGVSVFGVSTTRRTLG